jgi:hypothetical protein
MTDAGTTKEIVESRGDVGCPVDLAENHRQRLKA